MDNNFTTGRLLAFIRNQVGNPDDLATSTKENVVGAINEVSVRYEPKVRFLPTPVYSVTLAEGTNVGGGSDMVLDSTMLGGTYKSLWVRAVLPSSAGANVFCSFYWSDAQYIPGVLRTSNLYSYSFTQWNTGGVTTLSAGSDQLGGSKQAYTIPPYPVFPSSNFIKIVIGGTSGTVTLPAGTQITVYGAKEETA